MNLEDIHAIQRPKYEYGYAIDVGRYEEWIPFFTEDGRFIRASRDTFEGREKLLEFACVGFGRAFECPIHVVTNPVIDVNGDGRPGSGTCGVCTERRRRIRTGSRRGTTASTAEPDGWKILEAKISFGLRGQNY